MARKGIGNALRMKILARDGFKCSYCGRTKTDGIKLHVDHIIPVSKGGTNEEINLACSCSDCNHGKYNRILKNSYEMVDYNLDTEIDIIKEGIKKKQESKEKVKEYTLKKNELNRDFVFEGFLEGMEESGVVIHKEEYAGFKSLLKKHGIDLLLEACFLVGEGKDMSSKYVNGIISNILLKKKYEIGYTNYLKIKSEILYKIDLKYPLSKNQVEEIVASLNRNVIENLHIDHNDFNVIIGILKRNKQYKLINENVFELCRLFRLQKSHYTEWYILKLLSVLHGVDIEKLNSMWIENKGILIPRQLFKEEWLSVCKGNTIEGEGELYLYINPYG